MIKHSMVVENFFNDPDFVRDCLIKEPMVDHLASDGVIYPGIVELPSFLEKDLHLKFSVLFGNRFKKKLMFARHSYADMSPPHWAHSDLNMAQYVGIIYMNPIDYTFLDGTHCLRHRKSKLEIHPRNQDEIDLVMGDSNDKSKWEITYTCPAKYNRLFILNARFIHAAAYKYGTNRINSRLVLSVFFDLD